MPSYFMVQRHSLQSDHIYQVTEIKHPIVHFVRNGCQGKTNNNSIMLARQQIVIHIVQFDMCILSCKE